MKRDKDEQFKNLPPAAAEYIRLVIKKMGYRRKVRHDVQAELIAHFEDALTDCNDDNEKNEKVKKLIADFGDAKLLGILARRAKKWCRPLYREVIARFFQFVGILFICLVIYCIYLSMGKPTISVNYVQRTEELARPVADETLNAAPLYDQAINLYITEPNIGGQKLLHEIGDKKEISSFTPEELSCLKQWISDNNESLKIFKQATEKPYCWWKREAKDDVLLTMLMPELGKIRSFGYLLCWKAKLDAHEGRVDEAFNAMLTCYRAGMHGKGPRTLIEQLVGMAIESLACNASFIILQSKEVESGKLKSFHAEFEKLIASDTFTINFEVEKFWAYDVIQRCFTDDGKGSGHFVPSSFKFMQSITEMSGATDLGGVGDSNAMSFTLGIAFALISTDRDETVERFERAYDKSEQWAKTTPWQKHQANFNSARELGFADKSIIDTARCPLYYIFMPAVEKVIEHSYRNKITCEAASVVLAALRYKEDKGVYPETLNQLVETGYLKQLPMDPWSDKPLVYRKTDNNFILYGVGNNFIDDGGNIHYDEKGRPQIWSDKGGDAAFWPVAREKIEGK